MDQDIHPKEMALLLYKLCIENNAMLKQNLIMMTETQKMLRIITTFVAGKHSEKTSKEIRTQWERNRKELVECVEGMLPGLESIVTANKRAWLSDAIKTGDLRGTAEDYSDFGVFGKLDHV